MLKMRIDTDKKVKIWFYAALFFTALYSIAYSYKLFSSEFIVQDDARAHVFWAYKYLSTGYFKEDLMADYFETMAPYGYRFFYKYAAVLNIPPFLLNKLVPVILGFATCYYAFRLSYRIFLNPIVAFVATLLLNHMLWGHDNIPSGTPKAFVYPLLLASLLLILKKAFWPLILIFILESLFFPHALLISLTTYGLTLIEFRNGKLCFNFNRKDLVFILVVIGVGLLVLLPYAFKTNDFGPLVTAKEAVNLPEFQKGGRSAFFSDSYWKYWVSSSRSGMWPRSIEGITNVCLLLSLAFCFMSKRFGFLGLSPSASANIGVLYRLIIASLLLFFLAHLMLFHLHLPSRFTQHSVRIVVALLAAHVLVTSGQYIWRQLKTGNISAGLKSGYAYALLTLYACLLAYPLVLGIFGVNIIDRGHFKVGKQAQLYRFFSQQPTDSVVAVLSEFANNIPAFSLRSVVYSNEYAIAYHRGYYTKLETRRKEMDAAYLTDNADELREFIDKYRVSHFVIDDVARERWQSRQNEMQIPRLKQYVSKCRTFYDDGVEVIDAKCIRQII